jgi:transcriptional regulator with XRE-family HTH domain
MAAKAPPDFANRLRSCRAAAGISQRELARRCGDITNASVSLLEAGSNQPTLPTLRKLARALGVSIAHLLGE